MDPIIDEGLENKDLSVYLCWGLAPPTQIFFDFCLVHFLAPPLNLSVLTLPQAFYLTHHTHRLERHLQQVLVWICVPPERNTQGVARNDTVNLEGLLSNRAICHRTSLYCWFMCSSAEPASGFSILLSCIYVSLWKCRITDLVKLNSEPSVWMFVFIFSLLFQLYSCLCIHTSDFVLIRAYVCLCARVCFMCSLRLAGSPLFAGEASHGRRGLRLVRFMLNSVSISWLLPSLQQKSAERNTSPQKSSGFDRRSVQSFIPRPPGHGALSTNIPLKSYQASSVPSFLYSHSFHRPVPLYLTHS